MRLDFSHSVPQLAIPLPPQAHVPDYNMPKPDFPLEPHIKFPFQRHLSEALAADDPPRPFPNDPLPGELPNPGYAHAGVQAGRVRHNTRHMMRVQPLLEADRKARFRVHEATSSALVMPPHDLTPSELAELMGPRSHPTRLSAQELDGLTGHLPDADAELDELVQLIGISTLARQLPLIFHRLLLSAQRLARDPSPDYDDAIDDLIRHFDEADILDTSTPPPSSPEPPVTPSRTRQVQSIPSTPQTVRPASGYTYTSPAGTAHTVSWFEAGARTQGIRGAAVMGPKPRSAAYAIFFGVEIGVFELWLEVHARTNRYPHTIFAGYASLEAATAALQYARAKGWTGDSTPPPYDAAPPVPSNYEDNPLNQGSTRNPTSRPPNGTVHGLLA
ncbi:hypothetical protein C8R46DRAFT_1214524 [Mycena filopes]|nr:hypothetical protein C8R46DRAFT_1214524 [Mycena filopes]